MTEFACQGCGAPLAKAWTGRNPKWCSTRCRKASYGQPCVDCGTRTSHGAESRRVAEPRCSRCASKHAIIWTPEAVVAAIQAWVREHGEPPAVPDWNPTQARSMHDDARARRFENANGRWPRLQTVVRVFGSWNAAIAAAGFEPRRRGGFAENRTHMRQRTAA